MRNERNQVTLPNGSFVPNAVTGATLRERVQRYHQLYPEVRIHQGATVPQLFFAPVHPVTPAEPSYALATLSTSTWSLGHGTDLAQQIEARRQELYALEQQFAAQPRTAAMANTAEARTERAWRRNVRFDDPPVQAPTPPPVAHVTIGSL